MPQQITDVSRRGRRSARATRLALASLWLLLPLRAAPASAGQAAEAPAPATAQTAAPALPREQIRQFLETAPIIKGKATVKGVTRPMRVTLSDGILTHDAAFSTVDEHKNIERF